MSELTAARVQELLSYDPETGEFRWKARGGAIAGTISNKGYRYIGVDGKKRIAARLAFALMDGRFPDGEVDHIDRNPGNDRWSNLRVATRVQNAINRAPWRKTTTLPTGVRPAHRSGRFQAKISIGGKVVCLGTFDTAEEAHQAYLDRAKIEHKEFSPH